MTAKDKLIKIAFLPDWRNGNPYQDLLADSLRKAGGVVNFFEMPHGIFSLNRLPKEVLSSQIIHLHWINDLVGHIIWPQSSIFRRLKLLLLYFDIIFLRLRGVSVVWTIHNLVAHESINPSVEIRARRVIARACSHILVHSQSALDQVEFEYGYSCGHKTSVAPHGNYDECYPANESLLKEFKDKYSLSKHDINIMFFGSVRRYKGVARLLEAFHASTKSNLHLIIAGKSNTEELNRTLVQFAAIDNRIILIPEFISDAMVKPMFDAVDAVIIPFERTLTSGSTVLAMTMSKATILPVNAKIFDLVDDRSALFFNSIPELTELLNHLEKQDLIERGAQARIIADKLNWTTIGHLVYRAYEKSLGRRSLTVNYNGESSK